MQIAGGQIPEAQFRPPVPPQVPSLDDYRSRTRKIIDLFLAHKLSFADCIAALDAALADLIPSLTGTELPALRALLLNNNEIVMKEMERRGPP